MNNQISDEQLQKIIVEVQKISQQPEEKLTREQVKDILQQINLSPDLLDEAMAQITRKEALVKQQKRLFSLMLGAILIIIGGISVGLFLYQNKQASLAQIDVYETRLTLSNDNGDNLQKIDKQTNPEIYYRVTLKQTPIGDKLKLQCDWIDPNGNIAHQNNYETKIIDKQIWTTYCRNQFNNSSITGNWQVEMKLDNRVLSETNFEIK